MPQDEMDKRITMVEAEVRNLSFAMFGLEGTNGIRSEVKYLRKEFQDYVDAEQDRREREQERNQQKDRAVAIASVSSVVGLIGIVATLIVVLVTTQ